MTNEELERLEGLANHIVLRTGDQDMAVVPALVAEVRRLRGLVEAAFNEGQMSVDRDGCPEYGWHDSDALKALDGAERPDQGRRGPEDRS